VKIRNQISTGRTALQRAWCAFLWHGWYLFARFSYKRRNTWSLKPGIDDPLPLQWTFLNLLLVEGIFTSVTKDKNTSKCYKINF